MDEKKFLAEQFEANRGPSAGGGLPDAGLDRRGRRRRAGNLAAAEPLRYQRGRKSRRMADDGGRAGLPRHAALAQIAARGADGAACAGARRRRRRTSATPRWPIPSALRCWWCWRRWRPPNGSPSCCTTCSRCRSRRSRRSSAARRPRRGNSPAAPAAACRARRLRRCRCQPPAQDRRGVSRGLARAAISRGCSRCSIPMSCSAPTRRRSGWARWRKSAARRRWPKPSRAARRPQSRRWSTARSALAVILGGQLRVVLRLTISGRPDRGGGSGGDAERIGQFDVEVLAHSWRVGDSSCREPLDRRLLPG